MGAAPGVPSAPPGALLVAKRMRSLLTYIRLPKVPRAVVVRRLAMSVLCGGTLAVATFAPVHQVSAAQVGAEVRPVAVSADRAPRSDRASRGEKRSVPASGAPVRDLAGTGAAPAASAPVRAAPAPAVSTAPAKPVPPPLPEIAGLDRYQVENAATIVDVGTSMGVSQRGQIIAVATALQESLLYNLGVAVDHDSLGLFQQRPSAGWGTPEEITTPSYAARAFYTRLLDTTADWGCLTCAAQRVQGSAFPDAYAQHEWFATTIVAALAAN